LLTGISLIYRSKVGDLEAIERITYVTVDNSTVKPEINSSNVEFIYNISDRYD